MARSVSYCEPKAALAGQVTHFKFIHHTGIPLPAKTKLRFDLDSLGRPIDWQIPQTNPKKSAQLIYLELPNGKTVPAQGIQDKEKSTQFEFTLPVDIEAGEQFTIHLGSLNEEDPTQSGIQCQQYIQRRRPFNLYIDTKGKGDYKEPETFYIDIRGNKLYTIKMIVPSIVQKNQRFDVIVRFEDCFGNLTGNATENTLIELSHDQLRENLNWKLFVPETGFITLPNLYFNEAGVYKFKLKNNHNGDLFFSPPIKCFAETPVQAFWGVLHSESEKFDAASNIESTLRNFRDDKSMQFYASSSFESEQETSNDQWKTISNFTHDFNEDERFISFLGFQWLGSVPSEGLRQFVYFKDGKPILRKKDTKSNSLKKIYKSHTPKDFISIPSFTMAKGFQNNFENYAPEFERVVEIYNAWGSSECLEKEGNPRPIKSPSKKGINETEEGSLRHALNQNYRFGFVAGGLDDRGIYHKLYHSDQVQYSAGLTCILAPLHNRDSLMGALYQRSSYATTGEKMILTFNLASSPMGSELNTRQKPGLMYNRHISGFIAGTTDLETIEIIRNGKVLHTIHPKGFSIDLAFDDIEPLEKILIEKEGQDPFAYYYLRVKQQDGHLAWTSPIWIDHNSNAVYEEPAKPSKKKEKN
jgi:hypothetical protein